MTRTPHWQLLCIVGPMISFISQIVWKLQVCSLVKIEVVLDGFLCIAFNILNLHSLVIASAFNWRKHSPISMKSENISDLDNNYEDPQHCATLAYEIYENLREAEVMDSC